MKRLVFWSAVIAVWASTAAFGQAPSDSQQQVVLSLFHSNDYQGYLTPCG